MFRTMLESLCADDKKKSVKFELDSKYYPAMLDFYEQSFFFDYLLNLNGTFALLLLCGFSLFCLTATLQRSADLSQFWYREFYLELSMGEQVQVHAIHT